MTRVYESSGRAVKSVVKDFHSYSEPEKFTVGHVDLELRPLFDKRIVDGTAVLRVERKTDDASAPLILDTRGLDIKSVESTLHSNVYTSTPFEIAPPDPILGSALKITLPEDVSHVRITYSTSSGATALQWLDPAQTAAKRSPFLYTQSQEIHARSWIPLQDTPSVRVTYSAHIQTPRALTAVMSAENNPEATSSASHRFRMTRPIPPYLIALAVGEIGFQSTGDRTGVYAEQPLMKRAAYEFAEAELMLQDVEQLYGPYLWNRFDTLVLPPSFPFGGMENPCLIFVTPTLIVGDRSCVSVIAHELAHAWSGNLVTNATWRDFWLNEGFTTYIEYRIQQCRYGKDRSEMEQQLARQRLEEEMAELAPRDQVLHIDLAGRDPDCGATLVPYVKGALFLQSIERVLGIHLFDEYLKGYFADFRFKSITTETAIAYLRDNLLNRGPKSAAQIDIEEWISQPGIPSSAPRVNSELLANIDEQVRTWLKDRMPTKLQFSHWSNQEWLYFLRSLPNDLTATDMKNLDDDFHLTQSSNSEILHQWLLMAVRTGYQVAYPKLEEFLTDVGRRVYVKPIYEQLMKSEAGKRLARDIYSRVRGGYHPIVQATIDQILGRFGAHAVRP